MEEEPVAKCDGVTHHLDMGGKVPSRQIYYASDHCVGPGGVRCYNASTNNALAAVVGRILTVKAVGGGVAKPPKPAPQAMRRLEVAGKQLDKYIKHPLRMSVLDFPKRYTGQKRVMYEKAAATYLQRPLTKRDAHVKPFPKRELVEKGPPRLINPRSAEYNVALGSFLAPAEHEIYRALQRMWGVRFGSVGPVAAKGLNAEQLAGVVRRKAERFVKPGYVASDASRFDQHVSKPALRIEHRRYLNMYNMDKELQMLLRWQETNEGVGFMPDGKVGYRVDGVRMSGDFNTSLGNIILMLLMMYCLLDDLGIEKADAIDNGDDIGVMLEAADVDRYRAALPEYFLRFGFNMVTEPTVWDVRHLEFCQMRALCIDGRDIMVRNPRAVRRDTVFLHDMRSKRVARTIINSRGVGGLSMYWNVPVLGALYESMARVDPGRKAKVRDSGAVHYWSTGRKHRYQEPSAGARVEFWEGFGIMPDDQELLEQHLLRPFPINVGPWDYQSSCNTTTTPLHELAGLFTAY